MIIGHQKIVDYLHRCLDKGVLAHAYLFSGPASLGKRTLALKLAQALECSKGSKFTDDCPCANCQKIAKNQYPDFYWLDFSDPEVTQEGIERVRDLIRRLSQTTYQGRYKIGIIDHADLMHQEAANCLLKTLEEPPNKSLLILISSQPQLVLPTLVSRCQVFNFLPVATNEIAKRLKMLYHKTKPGLIQKAVQLSYGRPGLAINYLAAGEAENQAKAALKQLMQADLATRFLYVKDLIRDPNQTKSILDDWLMLMRAVLLNKFQYPSLLLNIGEQRFWQRYSCQRLVGIIDCLEKTQQILKDKGLNHRLALEILMMNL